MKHTLARLGVAAIGFGLAGNLAPAAASAATPVVLPNPCAVAPTTLVAAGLGVAKAGVHATLQSKTTDGFHIRTCTFSHKAVKVVVTLAPAGYGAGGGTGGPPGMVIAHPTGLGPKGLFLHDARTGTVFASANFVKDGLWGQAYSDASVAPSTVLALGRYMYAHVA
jgi:hypothetical protein